MGTFTSLKEKGFIISACRQWHQPCLRAPELPNCYSGPNTLYNTEEIRSHSRMLQEITDGWKARLDGCRAYS